MEHKPELKHCYCAAALWSPSKKENHFYMKDKSGLWKEFDRKQLLNVWMNPHLGILILSEIILIPEWLLAHNFQNEEFLC